MKDDYGSVDLFGLDEFGAPVGLGGVWGVGLGAGLQSGTAALLRQFTTKHKYAELFGALAGSAVGGGMMFFEGTRHAGFQAVVASLTTGGVRQLEIMLSPVEKAKARYGAALRNIKDKGLRQAVMKTVDGEIAAAMPAKVQEEAAKEGAKGVGLVEMEPTATIGGEMGMPTIQPSASIGMPPQLVGTGDYGMGQNPGANQAELVGPGVSGLASHFGTTIFG